MNRDALTGRVDPSARPVSLPPTTVRSPRTSPALRAVLDPVRASRVAGRRLRRAPQAPLVLALLRSAAALRFAQGDAPCSSAPVRTPPSPRPAACFARLPAAPSAPPPAHAPRRLPVAGFAGGDFPSVNAPRSDPLRRRSRFAFTPDRSPLQVSSRRAPDLHIRAFSATWAAWLLPDRVDAPGTRACRLEFAEIAVRRMLWRHRFFKGVDNPDAPGSALDRSFFNYDFDSSPRPCVAHARHL